MASYARPGLALDFLRDALGDELYKKALQEFMALWNGKHPIPYDFFFTFNRVTGEDLSWFWKPWFFENGYPDLAIKKVEVKKKKINVNVEKKGIMPIPIALKITYADSTLDSTYHSAKVWKRDNKEFTVGIGAKKQLLKIELGMPRIPDVDIENNIYMKK
jgi:aminopeptidase N